jgi:phosphatidylserine/phosphatidylglycerophosphate/cardiolipin synthase-like enzyme
LETRLLAAGITVARTANDLVRYHNKLMIIDRETLFLLGFNYTFLDTGHSRSFGIITKDKKLVQEAVRLFEADTKRQPFKSEYDSLIVSPSNARKQLSAFIKGAKKQLLIYDGKLTDPQMVKILSSQAKAGVEVRVIGRIAKRSPGISNQKLSTMRLHVRTIVRDGVDVFLGSQSLRKIELENRRETGVILRDARIVQKIKETFERDWASEYNVREEADRVATTVSVKRVVKEVVREAVKEVVADFISGNGAGLERPEIVKKAVKEAVKEAVEQVTTEAELVH